MGRMAIIITILFVGCIDVYGQEIPPVKFNHLYFVLKPNDFKALQESVFIKDSLAVFETRTTKTDSQTTWTGTYLYGHDNYLEFFKAYGDDPNLGFLGIGFSVDKIGELNILRNHLDSYYNTGIQARERAFDSVKIPWFDALTVLDTTLLDSAFMAQLHFWFWIMEYKKEYFDFHNYVIDNNQLTRENYLEKFAIERKNKMVKRFSGVVMKLNSQEKEYLTKFFNQINYEKLNENEFMSPDKFEFTIKNRDPGDHNSVELIKFETSKEFAGKKLIKISEDITITIEANKGQILFK